MSKILPKQHFGEWETIEYIGNRHWRCRCSCGEIKSVHEYKLTSGQSKSCGHAKNKFIDLKGQHFGEWEVLEYAGNHEWKCKCSCNKIKNVSSINLRSGKSKSCGHSTTGFKDIKGQYFGEWQALEYRGHSMWLCKCSCNKLQEVKLYDLLNGRTKSCGHSTTGFIDLKDQQFGEWTVKEYAGNQEWLCKCSCGTIRKINSQRLRTHRTNSCGCKIIEHMRETSLEKYGTISASQIHRTPEQIAITSNKENLKNFIISNFKDKPTPKELADACGLTPHRVMVITYKYELGDLIKLYRPVSSFEDDLNRLFPCTNRSDREILGGKELDLYYPDKNFAIEFNGNYWHNEFRKDKLYHQQKSILAAKKNIQVFNIFEYEWEDEVTREKLIKIISNKLYTNELNRVYARKCNIEEITNEEAKIFLEKHHLQGYTHADINIALIYNNNIMGIMTFGKPRFNSNYEYELIRLAFDLDYTIIGGSQKMFKHFITKYKPNNIVSYCDISKFVGGTYINLGFKVEVLTEPNYKWVNVKTNDVLTRYQTTKKHLLDLNLGTPDQTESEIMHNLGFIKIYDCGNFRFTWSNS